MPPKVQVYFGGIEENPGYGCDQCPTFNGHMFELDLVDDVGGFACWYQLDISVDTPNDFCSYQRIRYFIRAQVGATTPISWGPLSQIWRQAGAFTDYIDFWEVITTSADFDDYKIDCSADRNFTLSNSSEDGECLAGPEAVSVVVPVWD